MRKPVIGAAIGYDELRAWQAVTGRETPAVVPIGATLQVGRCTIRLEVGPGKDPGMIGKLSRELAREMSRRKAPKRSHWSQPPAKGVAMSSRPWVEASVRAIPDESKWEVAA